MSSKIVRGLVKFLEEAKKVYLEIPVQQLELVLRVAEEEGVTMPELQKLTGMSQGSVSRNVRELSSYLREEDDKKSLVGYGLLEKRPDLHNPRRFAVYLTDKGKQVVSAFEQAVAIN